MSHSAAMLDAVFSQAIPHAIVAEVREGQRTQQRMVRHERNPVRRLALERMPMWSRRASPQNPFYLLQADLADSTVLGQMLNPEARQALYSTLWAEFTMAAERLSENILFVKTIGDCVVFIGGLKPVAIARMFDLGNAIHAIAAFVLGQLRDGRIVLPATCSSAAGTRDAAALANGAHPRACAGTPAPTGSSTGSTSSDGSEVAQGGRAGGLEFCSDDDDDQMRYLTYDDIVCSGTLKVLFRCAVVSAHNGSDLLAFVSPTAGQVRLDFAGKYAEYVSRVEAAAPPGHGVLTDRLTAVTVPPGTFRISRPKTVPLKSFGVAELVLISPARGTDAALVDAMARSMDAGAHAASSPGVVSPFHANIFGAATASMDASMHASPRQ
eukprot:TRINITY_DN12073_c0_g1_i1.p2 TRINITY_DN12073_c0_g1~~TRINITY_DN12073_c0_g1_i1.p2  ORF type:complete len:422 (-),score=95.85 TRINITY_DN12073_c0_g1_i1:343-1488(-)